LQESAGEEQLSLLSIKNMELQLTEAIDLFKMVRAEKSRRSQLMSLMGYFLAPSMNCMNAPSRSSMWWLL